MRRNQEQQILNVNFLIKCLAIPAVLAIFVYFGRDFLGLSEESKDIKAFYKLAGRIFKNCHFDLWGSQRVSARSQPSRIHRTTRHVTYQNIPEKI